MGYENCGRHTIYTQETADEICRLLAEGKSLRQICRNENMPAESTVRAWAVDNLNDFYAQYTRARDLGLDSLIEETIEIADDGRNDTYKDVGFNGEEVVKIDHDHIKRSQLRVSARQWYAERMAPKKYGASQKVDVSGRIDSNVTHEPMSPAEAAEALIKSNER